MIRVGALIAALAGCATGATTPSQAPPRAWAVVPVAGTPAGFPDLLADALVRRGVERVYRPELPAGASASEAVAAARRLGAEAVLAVVVLAHDPYDPPRTTVRVEILRSEPSGPPGADLDRLVSSASWRAAPLRIGGAERHAWAAYDEVYDARDPARRASLRAYAAAHGGDGGFIGEREFLAVETRWLEFVAAGIAERAASLR